MMVAQLANAVNDRNSCLIYFDTKATIKKHGHEERLYLY